jgi:hypothetical protein
MCPKLDAQEVAGHVAYAGAWTNETCQQPDHHDDDEVVLTEHPSVVNISAQDIEEIMAHGATEGKQDKK